MPRSLEFICRHGISRFFDCMLCKLFYRSLQRIYRFHPWHASGAYPCREYKHRVVALASSLRPGVVVEVGCGLGEIITRIAAERRYGFDIEANVIAAARRLGGARAEFHIASVDEASRIASLVCEPAIDLLIMVNWPHGLSEAQLRAALTALRAVKSIRFVLIDTIDMHSRGEGQNSHSLAFLQQFGRLHASVEAGDGTRQLHLIAMD